VAVAHDCLLRRGALRHRDAGATITVIIFILLI